MLRFTFQHKVWSCWSQNQDRNLVQDQVLFSSTFGAAGAASREQGHMDSFCIKTKVREAELIQSGK